MAVNKNLVHGDASQFGGGGKASSGANFPSSTSAGGGKASASGNFGQSKTGSVPRDGNKGSGTAKVSTPKAKGKC